ncbi:MAG: GPW/gp25 family protein [Candidatus Methylomirabilis sp.]|nr:GPW/gp25 family protein [Deltaproteobacteria bacterium]
MPPVDLQDIRAEDWSPRLGSEGEVVEGVQDVAQCVAIIVATPPGSVAHLPEFAFDARAYMDRPINAIEGPLKRDLRAAILRWEPRVAALEIAVFAPEPEAGSLGVLIEGEDASGEAFTVRRVF